jgi:hypothetical protein
MSNDAKESTTNTIWNYNPKYLFRILAITSPLFLIYPSTIIHNNIIYIMYTGLFTSNNGPYKH